MSIETTLEKRFHEILDEENADISFLFEIEGHSPDTHIIDGPDTRVKDQEFYNAKEAFAQSIASTLDKYIAQEGAMITEDLWLWITDYANNKQPGKEYNPQKMKRTFDKKIRGSLEPEITYKKEGIMSILGHTITGKQISRNNKLRMNSILYKDEDKARKYLMRRFGIQKGIGHPELDRKKELLDATVALYQ